jgi:hypothetical protein
MEPSATPNRDSKDAHAGPQKVVPSSARISLAKRILYALFFPEPSLANGEIVFWTKICGWVKGGRLTKGGRLLLTNQGGIYWKAARYEIPKYEWHTTISELASVDLIRGNVVRKAQAPFAAGIRTTAALNTKDGVTRILVPSEAGRILLRALALATDVDIATAVTRAITAEAS